MIITKKFSFWKHLISLFIVIFTGIFGCTSNVANTELTVNKLHFQSGETLGNNNSSYGFSGSKGQSIKTKITREFNETEEVYEYSTETKTSKKFTGTLFFKHGISERVDVLLDGYLSIQPNNSNIFWVTNIGSRFYVKYRMNPRSSFFALSVMPGIGYTKAFETVSGNFYASSSTVNLDLNFPMSYRFIKNLAVHFGLTFSQLFQYGKSDDRTHVASSSNLITKFKNDYFIPGFTFGLSLAALQPEIRFDWNDEKFQTYFGMQFKLK